MMFLRFMICERGTNRPKEAICSGLSQVTKPVFYTTFYTGSKENHEILQRFGLKRTTSTTRFSKPSSPLSQLR